MDLYIYLFSEWGTGLQGLMTQHIYFLLIERKAIILTVQGTY